MSLLMQQQQKLTVQIVYIFPSILQQIGLFI